MSSNVFAHLTRIITTAFRPPFHGLPVIVWIYFALCFVLHPLSPIWHYNFVDTDDYQYLVQALDMLNGQSWFDPTAHRINPPEGTYIHFSRVLSGLYAIPIFFLKPWLGTLNAATVSAVLFPLAYFAIFLYVARRAADVFINPRWSRFTSFAALFSLSLMLQFIPGRVDHHGLQALLALTAFGFAARMMITPGNIRMAVASGVTLAFALMIALEILPVLLLITAGIGLWVIFEGSRAARSGFIFSIALLIASFVFLFTAKPPDHLLDSNTSSYSITYVILTAGIALCFVGIAFAIKLFSSPRKRLLFSGVFAVLVSISFFACFPELKNGPYGGADPAVVALLMKRASEAWPLTWGGPYTHATALPFLGLISACDLFLRNKTIRWADGLLVVLIAVSLALTVFCQQRMMVFSEAFSVIPLAYMAQRTWELTEHLNSPALIKGARIFAVLLAGPLTVILIPSLLGSYANNRDFLMFPVQITDKTCDRNGLVDVLNRRYGDRPHLIMNTMAQSSELLFRTQYDILAAPFHMDASGNLDSYAFFTAVDPANAEAIAHRRGAELVVMCNDLEPIYKSGDPHSSFGQPDHDFFAQQLIDGKIPSWLHPVNAPQLGNMMLFEVTP